LVDVDLDADSRLGGEGADDIDGVVDCHCGVDRFGDAEHWRTDGDGVGAHRGVDHVGHAMEGLLDGVDLLTRGVELVVWFVGVRDFVWVHLRDGEGEPTHGAVDEVGEIVGEGGEVVRGVWSRVGVAWGEGGALAHRWGDNLLARLVLWCRVVV